jgi:hypothetical protein
MYQKGPEFVTGAYSLPNIGREAHTYLHHIVRCYDDLAEYTVFVNDHLGANATVEDFCQMDQEFTAGELQALDLSDPQNIDPQGYLHPTADGTYGKVLPATMPFSQWFDRVVDCNIDRGVSFSNMSRLFLACKNNNFSVHRSCIQDKPKAYYESLLQWVTKHPNPEWARYINHSWVYIFMPANKGLYRIGIAGQSFDSIELSPSRCGMPRDVFALIFGTYRRAS